ncbi:MAG: hypothetical protein WCA24_01480, partial [Thiomonas sp.]
TGRGSPWLRGGITGAMTALGGLGHTLPYLIPQFHLATTLAFIVVAIELVTIVWIRKRYMWMARSVWLCCRSWSAGCWCLQRAF